MSKVIAKIRDGRIQFTFPLIDGMREWATDELNAAFIPAVAQGGRRESWRYELPATDQIAALLALTAPLPVDGDAAFNALAGSVGEDFLMSYTSGEMAENLPQPPIRVFDGWKHQVGGYHFLKRHKGRAMMAMGMGTGKSKTTIDYWVNDAVNTGLILCPPNVLGVWRREMRTHAPHASILILDDSFASVRKKREAAERFYKSATHPANKGKLFAIAINYESARVADFAEWAKRVLWDACAADESHRAKDSSGVTGKFLGALRRVASRRTCLTGTPMPHSPGDLHSQYRFIDSNVFGDSAFMFKKRYAVTGFFGEEVGWRHKLELRQKFHSRAYVVGSEVLELPECVHTEREFALPPATLKIYRAIWEEFVAETSSGVVTIDNALVKLIRAQQITSGFVPLDADLDPWADLAPGEKPKGERKIEIFKDNPKAALLREILADVNEPIVVFCRWHYDLDNLRAMVESLAWERNGVKPGNEKKRDEMMAAGTWRHFRYGELSSRPKTNPAFRHLHCLDGDAKLLPQFEVYGVQEQSGGVGVDFTRAALAVLYSISFSLGNYEQMLKRLDRPGQKLNVRFIHLIGRRTVDRRIYQALRKRRQVVESIIADVKAGLLDNLDAEYDE